jgi:hypothetical protein
MCLQTQLVLFSLLPPFTCSGISRDEDRLAGRFLMHTFTEPEFATKWDQRMQPMHGPRDETLTATNSAVISLATWASLVMISGIFEILWLVRGRIPMIVRQTQRKRSALTPNPLYYR